MTFNFNTKGAQHRMRSGAGMLIITLTALIAHAATPTLSRISCGSNHYEAEGIDACSVYLTGSTFANQIVTLSSNNKAVTLTYTTATVRAGRSTTGFNAEIASVTSTQTATITAKLGTVSKTFAITLSPPAITIRTFSVNATKVTFGNVEAGNTATPSVSITSNGTASVTVSAAKVSGTTFSGSGPSLPVTLSPGQSARFEVEFAPTVAGSYSGQLSLTSNATTGSTTVVSLTGTGITYEVDLTWDVPRPSSDRVVGYNVYRSSPSGSTSYSHIGSLSSASIAAYTDKTVKGGTSYSYIVRSYDARNVESAPSNSINVTIP